MLVSANASGTCKLALFKTAIVMANIDTGGNKYVWCDFNQMEMMLLDY